MLNFGVKDLSQYRQGFGMLIVLSAEPIQETDAAPAQAGKNSECVAKERGRLVFDNGIKQQGRSERAEKKL